MSTCSSEQDDKAASNRRNFPFAAMVLDDLREQFGPGVKLIWAKENGAEIGRPLSGPFCVCLPYEKASAIKKRMGK